MEYFRHIATSRAGDETHITGISDVVLRQTATGMQVYSASGRDGGIQVRNAALGLIDVQDYGPAGGLGASVQMTVNTLGGRDALLLAGPAQDGISGWWLDAAGRITGGFDLATPQIEVMTAMEMVTLGGQDYVFSAARGTAGITAWGDVAQGRLREIAHANVTPEDTGNDIFALEHVRRGGADYLLAVSADGNSLHNFRLSANGSMQRIDSIGPQDGMGISIPTTLAHVTLGAQVFMLVGASGSSTITVIEVGADGTLQLTDQVGDDRDTRFQSVSVLETIVVDGKAYVVAGGADDGLSLMTLLPNGRLLHLETIADDLVTALTNPASIALAQHDDKIALYTAGLTQDAFGTSSVGRFEVDPNAGGTPGDVIQGSAYNDNLSGGAGADQIMGGAGDDRLQGGGGGDIIADGAGSDRMWGGAGADIFVLSSDGENDTIEDFEIGVDRIDMSNMGRFYSLEALGFASTSNGARLSFGGETLIIKTADNSRLQPEDFQYSDLVDLWHISTAVLSQVSEPVIVEDETQPEPEPVPSTPQIDLVTGGTAVTAVQGAGGTDLLIGGETDPEFDVVATSVYRLYRATLDRAPDPDGHRNWVEALQSGTLDLDQAATGFMNSREFQNSFGDVSDQRFVTLLYNNVLDRAPDQGGLENWLGALSGGLSRAQVVTGFSESREFTNVTFSQSLPFTMEGYRSEYTDDVFRLYRATLDRAPDAQGLATWTARLADGLNITEAGGQFVASREFQNTFGNVSDNTFVTLLYNNVLDRAPDQGGFENWTGALRNGMSRGDVVTGFSQSAEFVAKIAPDVTAWVRGRGGDDVLEGGGGHNILFGGMWADTFVFDTQSGGYHEVVDLEPWDQLRFNGFGYTDGADARAHMRTEGADVVFSDHGVEVRLIDTQLGMLNDDGLFEF